MAAVRSTMKLLSGTLGLSAGNGRRCDGGGGSRRISPSPSADERNLHEEEKVCDDDICQGDPYEEKMCEPDGDLAAKLTSAVVDDWELLSEKSSSGGGKAVFVTHTGSVRSITVSVENARSGSRTGTPLKQYGPGKLQRSPSNSTIASEDCCSLQGCGSSVSSSPAVVVSGAGAYSTSAGGGARFHGLPGVDYVEHVVLPTDTLQGICLSYKISATRLRQANRFSGSSLLGAPKKLVVPLQRNGVKTGAVRMQDRTTREYKIFAFLAEEEGIGHAEAKSYLEQTNWVLEDALLAVRADKEWESSPQKDGSSSAPGTPQRPKHASFSSVSKAQDEHEYDDCSHRSGDIRITLRMTDDGKPVSAMLRAGNISDDSGSIGSGVRRRGVSIGIPFIGKAKRKDKKTSNKKPATTTAAAVNQSTCTARDILEHASGTQHFDGKAIELKDMSRAEATAVSEGS